MVSKFIDLFAIKDNIHFMKDIRAAVLEGRFPRLSGRRAASLAAVGASILVAGCAQNTNKVKLDTGLPNQMIGRGDKNITFKSTDHPVNPLTKLILGLELYCPAAKDMEKITVNVPSLGVSFTDGTCNDTLVEEIIVNPEEAAAMGGKLLVDVSASKPTGRWAIGEELK